ncbi:MAG TPA: hypothetical protein VNG51_29190 [Ktedonobacteraceae bacterium]|nr:hypothetical protein [Ktedonobacteraceae bacterium]
MPNDEQENGQTIQPSARKGKRVRAEKHSARGETPQPDGKSAHRARRTSRGMAQTA